MPRWLPILVILTAATGCKTHVSLRENTRQTAGTLTDLNYQQVLDNVARFVHNPASLPSVSVINAGTITVADQKSVNGSATYSPTITYAQQGGGALPIL